MFNKTAISALSLVAMVPAALAADVYLVSSGTTTPALENDQLAINALTAGGHTVTVGVTYDQFNPANVDLTGIDVVYLQPSWNWEVGDMPIDGQQQLVDFINNGGGLVTSEWTVWKSETGQSFQLLAPLLPAGLAAPFSSLAEMTFEVDEADPILNEDLDDSFTFLLTSIQGTHTILEPRPGATTYYTFTQDDVQWAGLVGTNAGCGRIASFATVNAEAQLEDPNFATLLGNSINWAAEGAQVPGDATGNNQVNLEDLNLVLANFGQQTTVGDVTGDGFVDLEDLNLVLANFGLVCPN